MVKNCRSVWTHLADSQLLDQCEVDTYRAGGPGGQKRNKTSSAVRLWHVPSGLIVIAEESRSQHENRVRAVRRLRQALYLNVREDLPAEVLTPTGLASHTEILGLPGRLAIGRKDARFWPAAALVLDVLQAMGARVHDAAIRLGISTGNLIDFLRTDAKLWEQANRLRTRFGQKPLQHF